MIAFLNQAKHHQNNPIATQACAVIFKNYPEGTSKWERGHEQAN